MNEANANDGSQCKTDAAKKREPKWWARPLASLERSLAEPLEGLEHNYELPES